MVGSPVLFGAPEVYRHVFPEVLLDGDFGGASDQLISWESRCLLPKLAGTCYLASVSSLFLVALSVGRGDRPWDQLINDIVNTTIS